MGFWALLFRACNPPDNFIFLLQTVSNANYCAQHLSRWESIYWWTAVVSFEDLWRKWKLSLILHGATCTILCGKEWTSGNDMLINQLIREKHGTLPPSPTSLPHAYSSITQCIKDTRNVLDSSLFVTMHFSFDSGHRSMSADIQLPKWWNLCGKERGWISDVTVYSLLLVSHKRAACKSVRLSFKLPLAK